jgi:quercetin dioxygenase-like cupin family protein
MKRIYVLFGAVLAVTVALCVSDDRTLGAQEQLKSGTILARTAVANATDMEAILVLRVLPPGVQSGKHSQSGTEIVYVQEGSIILEVPGKPPVTLKAGEAFHTTAGEVHNVKNASASAPAKALAFYIAKKGAALEDLSVPAK